MKVIIKNYNQISSYRNTSVSLGEREMLWEHEQQASVSTAFSNSPKLSRVFLELDRNTENMFPLLLENTATKKGKQLFYFDHQNVNSLCLRHRYVIIHVNSWYQFCVSIKLQKHDFKPISPRISLGLFFFNSLYTIVEQKSSQRKG